FVLLKDHLDENALDDATLRFMDWVGNRPHGVVLTYNYQSRKQWAGYFSLCGLKEETWIGKVPLYPWPFGMILGRGLHFVSLLKKAGSLCTRHGQPADSSGGRVHASEGSTYNAHSRSRDFERG